MKHALTLDPVEIAAGLAMGPLRELLAPRAIDLEKVSAIVGCGASIVRERFGAVIGYGIDVADDGRVALHFAVPVSPASAADCSFAMAEAIVAAFDDPLMDALTVSCVAGGAGEASQQIVNSGVEFFKIKSPDMLGTSQWTVQRNNRAVRVEMLHRGWLERYHRRETVILPGDSLKCKFEERIVYDQSGNEIERKLSIVEVLEVITPPVQSPLL